MGIARRWYLLAACSLLATGCAGFQPKPIVGRDVLRDLQRIRLDALRPLDPAPETPTLGPAAFDPADGLSADEAVAVALFLNPEIRAFRKERGVAEGERVAAGLLPNPQLQVTWLFIQGFTKGLMTAGWDVGISWSPPRPGERSAKVARAEARIEEVRAQIGAEEWRLATEVRKAHTGLAAAGERLRLVDASVALQDRLRRLVREKLAAGDASRLDVNLVELDHAERLREQVSIRNDHDRARLDLNRLLGLPPSAEVALQGERDLVPRDWNLNASVLEIAMVERREDLRAAKQEYEQAEQALRLAYIQRIPWFSFGPAYQRNPQDEHVNGIGIGLSIDLPLANLNQGEIARLEGARDKLREAFVAKVHGARAEINDALRNLRAQERLARLFKDTVTPALEESARLAEAALELGDVNALQFVAAQDKTLKGRRDGIETGLEYWKAVFELERALGARLAVVDGKEE
jgi:cobalt-zinc-cadmium efflux system outer membrane protein